MNWPDNWEPLKLNFGTPGVREASTVVVGREHDVRLLWDAVRSGSVRLLSERRMGKTWLLKRALAEKPDWAETVFVDAQGEHGVPELVREINRKLHDDGLVEDGWRDRIEDWLRRTLSHWEGKKVGPFEVPGVEHWSDLLAATCRHLVEGSHTTKAVLIIDELPFFLDKLIKDGQPEEATRLSSNTRSSG